jgi:hypothetical protein
MTAKQREGKKYERQVEEVLIDHPALAGANLRVGQWLRFEDDSGKGWAQPDFYIPQPDLIWLFECKLTFRDEALDQLGKLYGPLLAGLYPGIPQHRIVVCRDLAATRSGRVPLSFTDLEAIWDAPVADWYVWNLRRF